MQICKDKINGRLRPEAVKTEWPCRDFVEDRNALPWIEAVVS